MMLQKFWSATSTSSESGGNKVFANLFVKTMLALRKFHRLTGMLGTDRANLGGAISEDQCCDLGNFSSTRLSGKRLFGPTLAKSRSGLVPVFQRPE